MDDIRAQIYHSLDVENLETRVLEICRAEPNEPVECKLHTVSLNNDFDFVALSYLWGDPSDTTDILLNGHVFPITRNLESALRHIPKLDFGFGPVRWLWADAICINQQDLLERGSQVRFLMSAVYGRATYVIAWLGPLDETIARGLRILQEIGQFEEESKFKVQASASILQVYNRIRNKVGLSLGTHYPLHSWTKHCQELLEDHTTFAILGNFFQLPYWRRVWVFQELVLPKNVFVACGLKFTSLHTIGLAIYTLLLTEVGTKLVQPPYISEESWSLTTDSLLPPDSTLLQICHFQRFRMQRPEKPTAWTAQLNAAVFDASDPRDLVYGLQGLGKSNIDVDYSLPILTVYRNMIRTFLEEYPGNLAFLHGAGSGYGDLPCGWPSWIPSFRSRPSSLDRIRDLYFFGGSFGEPVTFLEDSSVLNVYGYVATAISIVHPVFTLLSTSPFGMAGDDLMNFDWVRITEENSSFPDFLQTFVQNQPRLIYKPLVELLSFLFDESILELSAAVALEWLDLLTICLAIKAGDPIGEDWRLDWSRLGVRDCANADTIARQLFDKNIFERPAWRSCTRYIHRLLTDPRLVIEEVIARCRRKGAISHRLVRNKDHRFFQSENGILGIGPPRIMPGDMMCDLQGCYGTSLLRPRQNSTERFEFIGKCETKGAVFVNERYEGRFFRLD
ncbi:hypothetical protein OPT61_g5367 [Boeremia exigua]|uniref:Uncharacterized protein n=1 Tax=Boeremia exigua TaxID=749465 RepID=A0ACC2IAM3_9PLEO|nr:hypothetical protein OPT61_g5367 [Boeremia exigua]